MKLNIEISGTLNPAHGTIKCGKKLRISTEIKKIIRLKRPTNSLSHENLNKNKMVE